MTRKILDISKKFDKIFLPSEGIFYNSGKSSLLVKYLTSIEEDVLSNQMLVDNSEGIKYVIDNLILDNDICTDDLMLCDLQGLLIYLRSTSFGDRVEIEDKCNHCKVNNTWPIYLHKLKFKQPKLALNNDKCFEIILPISNLKIEWRPFTFKQEIEFLSNVKNDTFEYKDKNDGTKVVISRESSNRITSLITSINKGFIDKEGNVNQNGYTDKEGIKRIVKNLQKKDFDFLKENILENNMSLDNVFEFTCDVCGEKSDKAINFDLNVFLSLNESHKQAVLEELFILTYYGKAITLDNAVNMPTVQRRWWVQRIIEEVEKKVAAEEAEMAKAKK